MFVWMCVCVYTKALCFYLEYSSLWYGDEDSISGEEPLDEICAKVTFTFRFLETSCFSVIQKRWRFNSVWPLIWGCQSELCVRWLGVLNCHLTPPHYSLQTRHNNNKKSNTERISLQLRNIEPFWEIKLKDSWELRGSNHKPNNKLQTWEVKQRDITEYQLITGRREEKTLKVLVFRAPTLCKSHDVPYLPALTQQNSQLLDTPVL